MEKTSFKVMKMSELNNGANIMYRASCACMDPDCDVWIDIEWDPEIGETVLQFYAKVGYWGEYEDHSKCLIRRIPTKIKNLWYRFKKAAELFFTGYLNSEGSFLMEKSEQIEDFIGALNEGLEKVRNWEKKNVVK